MRDHSHGCAKPPFAGPETVLAYLSRYTQRVATSNSRLPRFDETGVAFRYRNYRGDGADRQQVMTLAADEVIRRFPLHVRPKGPRPPARGDHPPPRGRSARR